MANPWTARGASALFACCVTMHGLAQAEASPRLGRQTFRQGPIKVLKVPEGWSCVQRGAPPPVETTPEPQATPETAPPAGAAPAAETPAKAEASPKADRKDSADATSNGEGAAAQAKATPGETPVAVGAPAPAAAPQPLPAVPPPPPSDILATCGRSGRPAQGLAVIATHHVSRTLTYASFHRIPNSILQDSVAPELLPDEIRALSHILGARGDNQYTNFISYPNAKAPAFHLSQILYTVAAGRLMIATEGTFRSAEGRPLSFDQSVISEQPGADETIDEITLKLPEPTDEDAARDIFLNMLGSIIWAP